MQITSKENATGGPFKCIGIKIFNLRRALGLSFLGPFINIMDYTIHIILDTKAFVN